MVYTSVAMSSPRRDQHSRAFPTRLFVAAVVLISACLATSALFTFTTLLRLRTQYLSNRGREIAAAVEAQARGPGRRNNAQFWQSLLEESYPVYADTVAYLEVVDQPGTVLAHAGAAAPTPGEVYVSELPLVPGRGAQHAGATAQIAGWRLRVGLYGSGAAFIRNQAYVHLAVSGVAVAFLVLLSMLLLRVIRRFLELEARERAQQHLRALGTMAAALAHEIRNPLGAMKGLTQLAQEELPPEHGAQAAMRTVVSEAERLERLVSDLLDFARPKGTQAEEFDVAELVAELRTLLRQRLQVAGVELETSVPPGLKARSDPNGLRQVLLNVLSNALDAVPREGRVSLSARREERGRALLVEIGDSGAGFGGRDPEELFQPFVTTKTRGTGLGLAVSRQIVEALGGSIVLANGRLGGALCSIRLPDLEPREAREANP